MSLATNFSVSFILVHRELLDCEVLSKHLETWVEVFELLSLGIARLVKGEGFHSFGRSLLANVI